MNRRSFLAGAPAALALAQTSTGKRLPIRKAMVYGNLPEKGPDGHTLSPRERFQMAKDAGFQAIECHTTSDPKAVQEFMAASRETGIKIHSVMNTDHWDYPLSSPDPAVVAKSMKGMETSLHNAKAWGAETVLLVPAVVNKDVGYREAWQRSQTQIRKLIPLAAELKVVIAIEEVWNHFLLSPIEFARYLDDFNSPWVKAYFDVGNVALFSFPQDWIRILGPRIVKVHLKDFSFRKDVASWDMLRDGDLDWKAIYRAFADIGYHGTASIEIDMRDEAQLREASRRFDLIVTGA